ncbi:unnamed protein product [Paramecium sonneborni]|uniref:Uncharacterized protein n=1 Tax=Paramecium sonneborni TaxID=65129 RepID=A0A8S1P5T2_9CILI|nr:unnamed protein product [Paramecium sonneborni]
MNLLLNQFKQLRLKNQRLVKTIKDVKINQIQSNFHINTKSKQNMNNIQLLKDQKEAKALSIQLQNYLHKEVMAVFSKYCKVIIAYMKHQVQKSQNKKQKQLNQSGMHIQIKVIHKLNRIIRIKFSIVDLIKLRRIAIFILKIYGKELLFDYQYSTKKLLIKLIKDQFEFNQFQNEILKNLIDNEGEKKVKFTYLSFFMVKIRIMITVKKKRLQPYCYNKIMIENRYSA